MLLHQVFKAMMIKNFLPQNSDTLTINGCKYSYLEVYTASSLDFSYGFCNKGWLVRNENKWDLIPWDSGNYLSFLKILELPHSKLYDSILNNVNRIAGNRNALLDFFPIENIVNISFKMESEYWSALSLEFILENNIYIQELKLLQGYSNSTWLSQATRHNLRSYISRIK
jgi:hypothetical protein